MRKYVQYLSPISYLGAVQMLVIELKRSYDVFTTKKLKHNPTVS
jgi:hypothetical protein